MPTVKGKCSGCSVDLELAVAEPFAGADLAAPLCPACTNQQFIASGAAIIELRQDLENALFPLGKVTITAGAINALADAGEHAAAFMARHARGDWGQYGQCDDIQLSPNERTLGWEATDDSGKINKSNLVNRRNHVMSEYTTARGARLWVITRLDGIGGTTVLRPEEY